MISPKSRKTEHRVSLLSSKALMEEIDRYRTANMMVEKDASELSRELEDLYRVNRALQEELDFLKQHT